MYFILFFVLKGRTSFNLLCQSGPFKFGAQKVTYLSSKETTLTVLTLPLGFLARMIVFSGVIYEALPVLYNLRESLGGETLEQQNLSAPAFTGLLSKNLIHK